MLLWKQCCIIFYTCIKWMIRHIFSPGCTYLYPGCLKQMFKANQKSVCKTEITRFIAAIFLSNIWASPKMCQITVKSLIQCISPWHCAFIMSYVYALTVRNLYIPLPPHLLYLTALESSGLWTRCVDSLQMYCFRDYKRSAALGMMQ